MPIVRRACAVAFLVGITCWMLSDVTDSHPPVQTLVVVAPTHGFVVSDIPGVVVWGVLVALGVRALR